MDEQISKDLELITGLLRMAVYKKADELNNSAMKLWFTNMKVCAIKDDIAVIVFENELVKNLVDERYGDMLAVLISEVMGYDINVAIGVDETLVPAPRGKGIIRSPLDDPPHEEDEDDTEDSPAPEPSYKTTGESGIRRLIYNPEYTFENFVVGESNQLAHSVAKYVSEHPAKKYNPLYIYGPPGVGKTHLMYAITNKVLKDNPDANITYIKGEEFTNRLVEAINQGKQVQFREKYRKVDMLLIDDVQFIAGKNSSQEEMFHTFNTLYEEHKQIILTADRQPKDMKGLEERLQSRFEGGMMADIQLPDYELRLAILRNKSRTIGLDLTNEVQTFLADKLNSNIRQIEGVIKKLSGITFLSEEPLSIDVVKKKVPEYLSENISVDELVKKVIQVCADYYEVSPAEVVGEKRDRNIRLARNAAMFLIKEITDLSFPKIGVYFNKKHTTVISNCKTVKETLDRDPSYAADIEQIRRDIRM